ncbi:MAG: hypothetical protein SPL05_05865 [Eubacteriales bacterium]|nr:hypothetical protein [Eubacteriales bacterium]
MKEGEYDKQAYVIAASGTRRYKIHKATGFVTPGKYKRTNIRSDYDVSASGKLHANDPGFVQASGNDNAFVYLYSIGDHPSGINPNAALELFNASLVNETLKNRVEPPIYRPALQGGDKVKAESGQNSFSSSANVYYYNKELTDVLDLVDNSLNGGVAVNTSGTSAGADGVRDSAKFKNLAPGGKLTIDPTQHNNSTETNKTLAPIVIDRKDVLDKYTDFRRLVVSNASIGLDLDDPSYVNEPNILHSSKINTTDNVVNVYFVGVDVTKPTVKQAESQTALYNLVAQNALSTNNVATLTNGAQTAIKTNDNHSTDVEMHQENRLQVIYKNTADQVVTDVAAYVAGASASDVLKVYAKVTDKAGNISDGETLVATYNIQQAIIVSDNPGTPVPNGYVRVTFDATADGNIAGKQHKVIDVLQGTEWNNPQLTAAIPANATYKDASKVFDKWNKTVPNTGNVTTDTFTATYKAQETVIVSTDPNTPVPNGYVRVTFDATADGNIAGKQHKVIDVLQGTTWDNAELKAAIPAKADYKDNGKKFEAWAPAVPQNGAVTGSTYIASYKDQPTVLVSYDPNTQVPDGYVRIKFDATVDGKIVHTTERYVVIDVLQGTEWDDPVLAPVIPTSAVNNDNSKQFIAWNPPVPTTTAIENKEFVATYTAGDQTPPGKPSVTPEANGSVTITPPTDTDGDLKKVIINYVDENGTPKEVTVTKGDDNKWTVPAGSDVTVDENTGVVTIPANKVQDGSTISAKSEDKTGNQSQPQTATVGNNPTPAPTDTDNDGIPDDQDPDDDNDGVNDKDEEAAGLNPKNPDSDNDGTPDGQEDADGDGINNDDESDDNGTTITDKDGDGKPDIITPNQPAPIDTDNDGIPDDQDPDDDNDGVNDKDEEAAGLNPKNPDSDGDGTPDGMEDTDGDGILNKDESDANSHTITDRNKDGKADIITPNTKVAEYKKAPKTGDTFNTVLYSMLALISILGIYVVTKTKKARR